MIDIFQISQNDQSLAYLAEMFGMIGDLLPTRNMGILGTVFKLLNTTALTLGALLVIYVTIVGLMATAHEGEFMGKKWSGLWVPIRTVLGIAALFPTPSGYSAIQIVFMWVILNGVGAADTLWTTVLKYSKSERSVYSVSSSGVGNLTTVDSMKSLFQSLICQAEAKQNYSKHFYCKKNSGSEFCDRNKESMLDMLNGPQVVGNKYNMGDVPTGSTDASCGTLIFCNEAEACAASANSNACMVCKAQKKTLAAIVLTLGGVADYFAKMDVQYLAFWNSISSFDQVPPWVKSYCAVNNYSLDPDIQEDKTYCCGRKGPDGATCGLSEANPMTRNLSSAALDVYQYGLQQAFPNTNFITATSKAYNDALDKAIRDAQTARLNSTVLEQSDWQNEAQSLGWIIAGGYYYKLSENAKKETESVTPIFKVDNQIAPQSTNKNSPMIKYRNNYDSAGSLANKLGTPIGAASSGLPASMVQTSSAIDGTKSLIMNSFMENLSAEGGVNPLVNIAKYGQTLMIVAQTLYAVTAAAIFGLTAAANVNPMAVGTGLTLAPFGEAVKATWGFIGPVYLSLLAAILSLGAMLAIYAPLIPFIIFSMGALGWLIATIEAMVAGPFVALGILSPGGQHELLGKAEPALMLLFNLFLRPSLMVLGLVASMGLAIVALTMVNAGFAKFFIYNQINSSVGSGMVELIFFIAAYTSLVITVLNKIFTVIYVVPERVLTWIGGQAVSYGEQEALGQVKHGIEGAASGAGAASKASVESVQGGVMGVRGAANAADKNKPVPTAAAAAGQGQPPAPPAVP